MKVASIQMVSGTRLDANLQHARQALEQAAQAGAELAVLPDYFCLMGHQDTDKLTLAEQPGQGPIQAMLQQAARELGLWVVGGTLPMATSDPHHVANTTLVWNPQGDTVARYDKIHLFRFDNGRERYDEAAVLQAGDIPTTFDLTSREGEQWRMGLSICYDLRFPELYRQMQADVLLVPAAFTYTTGRAHWGTLLRARAIENLAYVVASAQGGTHENGRQTWGHSVVYDPWGEPLAEHAEGPGMALAVLGKSRLEQVRTQLPALQHRKL
jgi:nitrilase